MTFITYIFISEIWISIASPDKHTETRHTQTNKRQKDIKEKRLIKTFYFLYRGLNQNLETFMKPDRSLLEIV